MRRILALILILSPASLHADDLRPDSSGAPILRVFPLVRGASNQVMLDQGHPLLSIDAVSDFMLKTDKRRVRVVLTSDDAQALSRILRAYEAVGVIAGDSKAVISGSHFDGSLTFDNPVAAYLRQRFHVKPDSNEVIQPPSSPFAAPASSL
jgi:hypothetical protein